LHDVGVGVDAIRVSSLTERLPAGLRIGTPTPPAEAGNPLNIPARIKQAEDVRLYNERRGYVPGQGNVIGVA
jgi:hypothetical protein